MNFRNNCNFIYRPCSVSFWASRIRLSDLSIKNRETLNFYCFEIVYGSVLIVKKMEAS